MLLGRPCTAHWCRLSCITTIFTSFNNSPISAGSSISSVSSPRNVTCHCCRLQRLHEALSPRPSYYLSATREIFASCDMSLRNLQITITIDVCYAKKRLPKPNVGNHKMFLKKHPISLFSVFRSWIFRQNIWKVWSNVVDMHFYY